MMNTRQFFAAFIFIIIFCICFLFYKSPDEVKSFATYALVRSSTSKTILYWNPFFGQADFYLGEGKIAINCPRYNNCIATHSRYVQNIDSFDAIIFHGINEQLDDKDLPKSRRPHQRYIFMALESPANRYINDEFDGFFNLTMTYQLNSDIVWTYADIVESNNSLVNRNEREKLKNNVEGKIDDKEGEEDDKLMKLIKGKKRIAVWYRSNCRTRGGREKYVDRLEKHVAVKKYGKCSAEPGCPKDQDCFKAYVEPNYFFYLSFENSLCDDYVTEKFFNTLQYHVVPVVYGGANYEKFAPPYSYINALDFVSPRDLASYLTNLASNITEYKKYFEWKKHYRVVTNPNKRIICDLCELLNGNQTKTYDISKWYSTKTCPLQRKLNKQISMGGSPYATKRTLSIDK